MTTYRVAPLPGTIGASGTSGPTGPTGPTGTTGPGVPYYVTGSAPTGTIADGSLWLNTAAPATAFPHPFLLMGA